METGGVKHLKRRLVGPGLFAARDHLNVEVALGIEIERVRVAGRGEARSPRAGFQDHESRIGFDESERDAVSGQEPQSAADITSALHCGETGCVVKPVAGKVGISREQVDAVASVEEVTRTVQMKFRRRGVVTRNDEV